MNAVLDLRQRLRTEFGQSVTPSPAPARDGLEGRGQLPALSPAAALFVLHGSKPGPAHLFGTLLQQFEREFPIKALLHALPVGGLDKRPETLVAAMANLGFYVSEHRFSWERWTQSRLPLLIEGQDGPRLLVADSVRGYGFGQLSDGVETVAQGPAAPALENARCWSFRLASALDPLSPEARVHTSYSWARALLQRFPGIPYALVLLSLMLAVTGILYPLLIAVFFGEVIRLSYFSTTPQLIAGLVLLAAVETVFVMQRAKIAAWLASRLEFIVNTSSFAQILKLSPTLSERAPPTSQAARLRSFESIRDFCSGPTFSTLLDLPIALLSLIFVALLSPPALVIILTAIGLFLAILAIAWRRTAVLTSIAADEATELQRIAIETLDKLDLIRASGMQDVWCRRIDLVTEREQRAQLRLRFVGQVAESVSSALYTLAIIGVMAVSAVGVWEGQMTGPALLALVIVSLRILLPFQTTCLSVLRFEQIRRSLKQINVLMDLPTEGQAEQEQNRLPPLSGRLTLVNVGFRAADTRPVFVGLDLDVEPGELIGIYGANGTGKSTIFKMLLGMLDTTLGAVRIDGIDVRQLPLRELRRRVSYIPQSPRLFPGTLRQNLLSANPLATDDHLRRILAKVDLGADIDALPRGLDEHVSGPDDDRFSESFRYRFAFARALLIGSKVFLIDEIPNALLDGELGPILTRLLKEFSGNRTVMFVSHRSDFLMHAHRVVALRYGKVPLVNKPQAIMERAS